MEELRLSWRARRCAVGRGAAFVGAAPSAQVAAVERVMGDHVRALEWGTGVTDAGESAVRFLQLSGEGWVRPLATHGPILGMGPAPVTLGLRIPGERAAECLKALATTGGECLFVATLGLSEQEERALHAARSRLPGPAREDDLIGLIRSTALSPS